METLLSVCFALFIGWCSVGANPICKNDTQKDIIANFLLQRYDSSSVPVEEIYPEESWNLGNEEENKLHSDQCPYKLEEIPNANTNTASERNTCPTYEVVTRHSRRYPVSVREVRCKCAKCVENSGPSASNVCERFYETMVVLEWTGCVEGVGKYEPRTYQRQIGCFCARRPEMLSGSQVTNQPGPASTQSPGNGRPTPL